MRVTSKEKRDYADRCITGGYLRIVITILNIKMQLS